MGLSAREIIVLSLPQVVFLCCWCFILLVMGEITRGDIVRAVCEVFQVNICPSVL